MCRRRDGRWSRKLLNWQPRTEEKGRGIPPSRWQDDIVGVATRGWKRKSYKQNECK